MGASVVLHAAHRCTAWHNRSVVYALYRMAEGDTQLGLPLSACATGDSNKAVYSTPVLRALHIVPEEQGYK